MCLDHIMTHETYHFFHALPLKLAPTCFTKQCGTSRTQEFEYTWWSGLQIMLNVLYNTRYMPHVKIKMLIFLWTFLWVDLQTTSSTHLTRSEDKWSPREDKRINKLDFFFLSKLPLFGHVFRKSTHSLVDAWPFFLVHIQFTPRERPKDFCKLIL